MILLYEVLHNAAHALSMLVLLLDLTLLLVGQAPQVVVGALQLAEQLVVRLAHGVLVVHVLEYVLDVAHVLGVAALGGRRGRRALTAAQWRLGLLRYWLLRELLLLKRLLWEWMLRSRALSMMAA